MKAKKLKFMSKGNTGIQMKTNQRTQETILIKYLFFQMCNVAVDWQRSSEAGSRKVILLIL
jgi:hypothetical protein